MNDDDKFELHFGKFCCPKCNSAYLSLMQTKPSFMCNDCGFRFEAGNVPGKEET